MSLRDNRLAAVLMAGHDALEALRCPWCDGAGYRTKRVHVLVSEGKRIRSYLEYECGHCAGSGRPYYDADVLLAIERLIAKQAKGEYKR